MMNRLLCGVQGWAIVLLIASTNFAAGDAGGAITDDRAWKALSERVEALNATAGVEKPDYAGIATACAAARKDALDLNAKYGRRKTQTLPDVELPEKAPVVTYGKAGAADVRARWHEQLVTGLEVCRQMRDGVRHPISTYSGWPYSRDPNGRPWIVAVVLRESERVAGLLARPADVVRFKRGELLFSEDFAKGTDRWLMYGQCVTRNEGDAFRFKDKVRAHPDSMMWTRQEFDGHFVAEFTFIPNTEGKWAGALFTICGRPRPGKDLSVCVGGSMSTYNNGIDGYHFSMHRGTTKLGNVRRVGPGLKMLASGPDPCPTIGQAYRVSIGKVGASMFLLVDGTLIHNYVDAGTFGPLLTIGHIGIRHFGGLDASYRDFRVYRLVEEQ